VAIVRVKVSIAALRARALKQTFWLPRVCSVVPIKRHVQPPAINKTAKKYAGCCIKHLF
jgi:hypothetical protein